MIFLFGFVEMFPRVFDFVGFLFVSFEANPAVFFFHQAWGRIILVTIAEFLC